jgi:hypothetical protein
MVTLLGNGPGSPETEHTFTPVKGLIVSADEEKGYREQPNEEPR